MDLTSINTAASSLKIAMELAGSLVGLRDFSKIETATSQLREALIAAQTALLVQNDTLFQLQREKFDTAEELRKLKETITQKERYTLLEISRGTFVYGMNVPPQQSGSIKPGVTEPMHYICQPCIDNRGWKSVLQYKPRNWFCTWFCTVCNGEFGNIRSN
ncbi:hypothetical protein B9J09_06535 [Xylella fastidiosa subsp. pauca]|nr:hypothetical protein B9J09_06535 [Xylella fastidiosa subsp. pauca]AVI22841.1 hypothetical protein BC375_06135 [Xylella fastidiosa]KXB10462.1 hypothetical protein ADT32_09430 [Xylella fastidiosa]KXB11522.1 hypothetical protein ADT33_10155 [Xylella fastidiosa]KXB15274.1 hypothetical protein ADT31_08565 [Xylella fastidiosa]